MAPQSDFSDRLFEHIRIDVRRRRFHPGESRLRSLRRDGYHERNARAAGLLRHVANEHIQIRQALEPLGGKWVIEKSRTLRLHEIEPDEKLLILESDMLHREKRAALEDSAL